MPASIAAAKAGVTTGEWGAALRAVFGEYRAPTGVARGRARRPHDLDPLRGEVERVSLKLGRRLKFLVGKPGLDGHSNGAEQIAVRARDAGMEVVYDGIRLTPRRSSSAAKEGVALRRPVDPVGIASGAGARGAGSCMKAAGLGDVPVVVGGIIPPDDEELLRAEGVAAVYTPKDFDINAIMGDIVRMSNAGSRSGRGAREQGWRKSQRRRERGRPRAPTRGPQDSRRGARGGERSQRIAAGAAVGSTEGGAVFGRDGLFSRTCVTNFRRATARRGLRPPADARPSRGWVNEIMRFVSP